MRFDQPADAPDVSGEGKLMTVDGTELIRSVTQRVLDVSFPTEIVPSGDGTGCAVTFRSPGSDRVHLYRSDLVQVGSVATKSAVRWFAGGFLVTANGALQRFRLDGSAETLGTWPGRSIAAAGRVDLWLTGHDVFWRHTVDGSEEKQVRCDAPLLGGIETSPDGQLVAVRAIEPGGTSSLRLFTREGEEVGRWQESGWCVLRPSFVGDGGLVLTRMRVDSRARDVVYLDLRSGDRKLLFHEDVHKGLVPLPPAVATKTHAAYIRHVEGWPLLCVVDLFAQAEVVVNPGSHEDLTDVSDTPSFSPDGRRIAFNSSAADLRERHLYAYDLMDSSLKRLTQEHGATGAKAWLDDNRLAYVLSEQLSGARLCWTDLDTNLQGSEPGTLDHAPRGLAPTAVTLEEDAVTVPADLYLPPLITTSQRRPAIVYAHGGVFRQLTRGYPASFAYTLLHEVNLGLVELGFVVMSVEYRGSMGYGLQHDHGNYLASGVNDTADCGLAARYLAQLPYVDPKRIGIWGLSWGGTMALQALVRYPDLFAAGVSMAGIWDFEQRSAFWNTLQAGNPIYFDGRMGPVGSEVRRQASARTNAANLRAPLLSLHGTHDESVDFAQQTLLEADARRLGKPVRTMTFEGEAHVFGSAEAWERAVPEILGFLIEHLGSTAR